MQIFSATQAISPAINRTKSLLFEPFQWWTFLKLCAVAVFTEGFSGNFNLPRSGFGGRSTRRSHIHTIPAFPHLGSAIPHVNPVWIAALFAIAVAVIVVVLILYYLSVRLRFALFECLIRQSTLIAPGWYKYRFQAFRFFLLSLVVGIAFFAVIVAVLIPFALGFWHVYQLTQTGGPFPLGALLTVLLPCIAVIFVVVLAAISVRIILRDFMLPHIALENASAGQAWAAVRARIAGNLGAFLFYGLLRVVLPIVAVAGLAIILFLPCLIVFGLLAIMMAAVYAALISHAAMPLPIIGWAFEAILGLVLFVLGLLLALTLGGPLKIGVRNYALLFYGGHYQTLGDILYPPLAPPPAMQPQMA